MPTPRVNKQLIDQLDPYFQRRKEAQFAWKSVVSNFLALPANRETWTAANCDYTNPQVHGLINGHDLTNHNGSLYDYDGLVPYIDFVPAASYYLARVDGGANNWADIDGLETYVSATKRGLYTGGWFWFDDVGINISPIGKWNDAGGANQRSYMIFLRAANSKLEAYISSTGTAATTIFAVGPVISASQWYFVMLNYDPSTKLSLWVGDSDGITEWTLAVGIPASIFDSTADFQVGRYSATGYMDGRASIWTLGAADLGSLIIPALFEQTRAFYGA